MRATVKVVKSASMSVSTVAGLQRLSQGSDIQNCKTNLIFFSLGLGAILRYAIH